MARIKKHQNAGNHQETKYHRRKLNIPELVYKFLIANEDFDNTDSNFVSKCRCCGQKKRVKEIIDSLQTGQNVGSKIKQERRKDRDRISKLHNVKRCSVSKNLPISSLQNCVNSEDIRKAKRYVRKALNFGVDSGYLIPSNSMYKILRVSSDLMRSDSRRSKINICGMAFSKNRDVPSRLEELQEQRKKQKRHKQDQKSRSGSRMRYKSKRRRKSRKSRSRKQKIQQTLQDFT
ncbi:uncharacterized protein LOC114255736 isoform X2 [Monomorium pharaonis]|uniref:uncharacterized protein LOC114255736 isoform X2 n=1 Tax=Monomorium pharaonis TaxID=307658 RepID=UPI001746D38B|nr:uncharacterized protein LOC114255736 isoform X2 [Monomorium pharaonis]